MAKTVDMFADMETTAQIDKSQAISHLAQYAFLYTATEKGNATGIRFCMIVEDAQRWCSCEVSRGILHGTKWAYFFTRIDVYLSCHWGGNDNFIIYTDDWHDDGSWDKRITDAGCHKITPSELRKICKDVRGLVIV